VNNPCRAATFIALEKGVLVLVHVSPFPYHRLSYSENAAVPVRIEMSFRQHRFSLAVGVDFMLVSVPSFWCTKDVLSASETAVVNYQYLLGSTSFMAQSATLDSRLSCTENLSNASEIPILLQHPCLWTAIELTVVCISRFRIFKNAMVLLREHVWLMMSSQLPRQSR
jgi:hypothetical protein